MRAFRRANDSGAVIILLPLVLGAFSILGVLAVDLSSLKLTARQLQRGTDALALASTNELDGSKLGWRSAKRATFMTLRENRIHGNTSAAVVPGSFGHISEETVDPIELNSPYRSTHYDFDQMEITIERGYYGSYDGGATYEFRSLEGIADSTVDDDFIGNIDRYDCPCLVWEVANATRIEVVVSELSLSFAQLLPGLGQTYEAMTRTSISARNDFFENM